MAYLGSRYRLRPRKRDYLYSPEKVVVTSLKLAGEQITALGNTEAE
jgi:hypothetical protein